MTYDPIMGVRYILTGTPPCTEPERAINVKVQEQFNRTRHIRAKQWRRANNTKSK